MGRYYWGDIEGKFMFAVQSSSDADFFGVTGESPNTLEYYFTEENLPSIKAGLTRCDEALGTKGEAMEKYLDEHGGWEDKELSDYLSIHVSELDQLLVWLARRRLGRKILKAVENKGECRFTAEF